MKNESGNTAAVNFLGKVMREQPEVIEELSPRDAYMLFNYSDPETGRSQTELGKIFGISNTLVGRKIKKAIKQTHIAVDTETQEAFPEQEVLEATSVRSDRTKNKYKEAKEKDWRKPEYREKTSSSLKGRTFSEESRKKMSKSAKARHLKQKRKNRMRKKWLDPVYKAKMSEASKAKWQDKDYKDRMSKARKLRCQNPRFKKKMSEISTQQWQNKEHRAHMSEATSAQMKTQWQDPVYREGVSQRMIAQWQDPIYREARMEELRTRWQDPDRKARMIAKLKKRAQSPEQIDWSIEDKDFDIDLWEYSLVHNLFDKFLSQGFMSLDELRQLERHFTRNRRESVRFQRTLNKFSILVANAA